MPEDVQIKVTLDIEEARRNMRGFKQEAESAAQAVDSATGGDGTATGTRGRVPARRTVAQRFGAGGTTGLGGAIPGGRAGLLAGGALAALAVGAAARPAFSAIAKPGATAGEFGAGLAQGTVDLVRNVPLAGQAIGAVFDRTVGTALNAREQAIQATAQATSGLAAAGIQVDQQTLSQINAVQLELAARQIRNEAAARRAAPGILDTVFGLKLE